jgi:hypothetical protein
MPPAENNGKPMNVLEVIGLLAMIITLVIVLMPAAEAIYDAFIKK